MHHMAADAPGGAGAFALPQRKAHRHGLRPHLYHGLVPQRANLGGSFRGFPFFHVFIGPLDNSLIADADQIIIVYPGQPFSPLIHRNLLFIII